MQDESSNFHLVCSQYLHKTNYYWLSYGQENIFNSLSRNGWRRSWPEEVALRWTYPATGFAWRGQTAALRWQLACDNQTAARWWRRCPVNGAAWAWPQPQVSDPVSRTACRKSPCRWRRPYQRMVTWWHRGRRRSREHRRSGFYETATSILWKTCNIVESNQNQFFWNGKMFSSFCITK